MKSLVLSALLLGAFPALSLAEHRDGGGRWNVSIGVGATFGGDRYRGRDYGYKRVSYYDRDECSPGVIVRSRTYGRGVVYDRGYYSPPVVYAPPVTYYAPPVVYAPPVTYCPPPVVYAPPVIYCPPPVVYAPPPMTYCPRPVVYAPPRFEYHGAPRTYYQHEARDTGGTHLQANVRYYGR